MRTLMATYDGIRACRLGRNLPSLDFAGLSALLGSNATKAGIPYTCLVRSRVPYLNLYVPAGTLGLAQAVLACIDWRPARFLIGTGEAGSMLELCGVKASENATYVGLQSGTTRPVRGVVGEAVVLELVRQGKMQVEERELELVRQGKKRNCETIGRNSARPTYVVWAQIHGSDDMIAGDVDVRRNEGALFNFVAASICVVVLALEAVCHEWFSFALVATGMILNATMAFLLRVQKFKVASAKPAESAPPGDSVIVLKDDPDVLCVLLGSEAAIQKLLQKEVVLHKGDEEDELQKEVEPQKEVVLQKEVEPQKEVVLQNENELQRKDEEDVPQNKVLLQKEVVLKAEWVKHLPLFLVSVALMIYSAVVVLGVPHFKPRAQFMFLIVVCVGATTDLLKGSWNGKRGIAKEALRKYDIGSVCVKKFGNRTAAVACVAVGSTKLDALKAAGLCTKAGTAWKAWWNALRILDEAKLANDTSEVQEEKLATLSASVHEDDKGLWEILKADMLVGRENAL